MAHKRALNTPNKEWMAIVVSLVVMTYALFQRDFLVSATIMLCLGIAWVEVQPYWWHAAILLYPLMCMGTFKDVPNASGLRAATIGWLMVLQPVAWESVVHFLVDFRNGFHIAGL
jgi:endonuclease/exonuclease/phosphatase (EEP) superfamily protein YafD